MKTQILFRKSNDTDDELEAAQSYFDVKEARTHCKDSLVLCRYSALPFYNELTVDLRALNCIPVNSLGQHLWISQFYYYDQLRNYTPQTWKQEDMPYLDYDGPFVVKGVTNSLKHRFNTKMFASNKKEAMQLGWDLGADGLLQYQDIIYRKFIPLEYLEESFNGLKIANEWRFFFLYGELVDYGFYWSQYEFAEEIKIEENGIKFARKMANICKYHCDFFVIDIAKTDKGEWIVVELNDGNMSGLSMIDPNNFYKNLKNILERKK